MTQPAPDDPALSRMTFREHLAELRTRAFRATVGIVAAFFVLWNFHVELYALVSAPVRAALARHNLFSIKALHLTESIETYMKLSLVGALFLASPWVFWQVWAFVAPGLLQREKKLAVPVVAGSVACFLLGGLFCWLVVLPFMTDFLIRLTLEAPGMAFEPTLASTVSFSLLLIVAFGAVFELPLFMYVMAAIGLVGWRQFWGFYRYWVVIAFVLGAILTPTPDPINQSLMSAPLVLLYGVGIGIAWLVEGQGRARRLSRRAIALVAAVLVLLASAGVALALRERDPGLLADVPADIRQLVGMHTDNQQRLAQQAETERDAAHGLAPFDLPEALGLGKLHSPLALLARFDDGFALLVQVESATGAVARIADAQQASAVQTPTGASVWFALHPGRRLRAVAAGSHSLWLGDDAAIDRLADVRQGRQAALIADDVERDRVAELMDAHPLWAFAPHAGGAAGWLPGGALGSSVQRAAGAIGKEPEELTLRFECKGNAAAAALRDRIDAWVADARSAPGAAADPRLRSTTRRLRALSMLIARATETSARSVGTEHPEYRTLMVLSTEAIELAREFMGEEDVDPAP
ncbi:MAG: twin-arginine translocase subunit TatC, partial [Myxococcales bacterium]|nr:twin-arginine translocase subunit TatC [Myxococcales bacterium]